MPSGRTQVQHSSVKEAALGALAANTAIEVLPVLTSNRQGAKISKCKFHAEMKGKTANQGPILVGLSAGVSIAEVAEALLASPVQFEDPGASEQANRKMYPVFVIGDAATGMGNPASQILNHLMYKHTGVPSWLINEDETFRWWAFNTDSAPLTSGTLISVECVTVYQWERD